MRIHQLSTFPYGGAGGAAKRLHDALVAEGADSHFYYWNQANPSQPPGDSYHALNFQLPVEPSFWNLFEKRKQKARIKTIHQKYDTHLATRDPAKELFSMAAQVQTTGLSANTPAADIYNLHWMAFFIDYQSFFASIPDTTPIVWTLHDMNPFTGGCHYSGNCQGYQAGCGNCPEVIQSSKDDVSRFSFQIKQKALAAKNLHIVAPSQWLLDLAKQSPVFPKHASFQVIPYGLDLDLYHPIEKENARKQLGIQSDKVLLGFGAEDINNYRKGFQHLIAALPHLKDKVECLVFGRGELPAGDHLPKMHQMGFIDSPKKQAQIYSAADVFVMPSREDNSPQTGLEALACGTPVVAFDAGGVPEYVLNGETGITVEVGDESALAKAIIDLSDNPHLRMKMGQQGRAMMLQKWTFDGQAKNYLDFYQQISGKRVSLQTA